MTLFVLLHCAYIEELTTQFELLKMSNFQLVVSDEKSTEQHD